MEQGTGDHMTRKVSALGKHEADSAQPPRTPVPAPHLQADRSIGRSPFRDVETPSSSE